MKPAKLWILGGVLLFSSGAWAQQDEAPPAADVSSEDTTEDAAARALAVYEQGKLLYDAQDYAGALARFDEAAAIEPGKARWQYNRGLALRKLGRTEEARAALLQSRALEPDYKRVEIDGKLNELAAAESGPQPLFDSPLKGTLCFFSILGGTGLFFWFVWTMVNRPHSWPKESIPPAEPIPTKELDALEGGLERISDSLIQVEHALSAGEDGDLRALLNQATMAEQRARHALNQARQGSTALRFVEEQLGKARDAEVSAVARARDLFGELASRPGGERVGCYFCARPLANPGFRMRVPLKRGAQVTEVLACPPCANIAASGQPPPVKVRRVLKGPVQHWSEVPDYDPYTHQHRPFADMYSVPAWQYTPQRSLGEVAAIAAGGALATGLAAYGVSRLLDLDNAGESAAAQAATQAAAKKASARREERDWKDHS